MHQSRMLITYSLHRKLTNENHGRMILRTMADAVFYLFSKDELLSELIVTGKKLVRLADGADFLSGATWDHISQPNKIEARDHFYGGKEGNSYIYDSYETHVVNVDVDAGVECGPNKHFPHFHVILTIDHFTYVQFDSYKMRIFFEQMFKGVGDPRLVQNDRFVLWNENGYDTFYDDNENPYLDTKLYPADNWREVIAGYVRKGSYKNSLFDTLERRSFVSNTKTTNDGGV